MPSSMRRHKLGTEKGQINRGQVKVGADSSYNWMLVGVLMKQGGIACMSEEPVKSMRQWCQSAVVSLFYVKTPQTDGFKAAY